MNPLKLVKFVKPLIGLFISTSGDGDSTLSKNWRPYTVVSFVVLIGVSFFTSYELTEGLLAVIGVVIVTYIGGRSYEKKAAQEVLKLVLENEKQKREDDA